MTIYSAFFYITAALIISLTGLAITRENMVHAVLYLVAAFINTAILFYLLGAPLLAIFQVIIYAGAIMVLFLFIIMMVRIEPEARQAFPFRHYLAAGGVFGIYLAAAVLLTVFSGPGTREPMSAAYASPFDFGVHLFTRHWLSIEILSLLLLVALIGSLHLGKRRIDPNPKKGGAK